LTDEIKELGFVRVYSRNFENGGGEDSHLFIEHNSLKSPVECKWIRQSFKQTEKELKQSLTATSVLESRTIKKFIVLFSKLIINFEQENRMTHRQRIINETLDRRNKTKFNSIEEWQVGLRDKYEHLK